MLLAPRVRREVLVHTRNMMAKTTGETCKEPSSEILVILVDLAVTANY